MKFAWPHEPDDKDADEPDDDIGLTNPEGLARTLSFETARMDEALNLLTETLQRPAPSLGPADSPDVFRPVKFHSRPSTDSPAET